MTTMNREEQKQVLIDTANHIINRDNTSPYSENLRELARIALASLEAEPVGAFHIAEQQVDGTSDYLKDGEWPIDNGIIEVYAAPPAPVSVPAAMEIDDDFDSAFEHGKAVGWNAYRAAMLQAEPVSNSDELPLDYLQGHKDGLEWAAQLAEANNPQTGDWLYDDPIDLARAIRKGPDMPTVQGGNSPVIPDGWVMVPVEPTIAILDEFDSIIDYGAEDSKDAWSRLLAAAWIKSLPAAPRQEVNRG
ncbi:hypothetical protein AC288_001970 [Escherichia coli]|nr:hypothetical protein [Escherichia coli]